jgi:hypothetical protein
MRKAFRLLCIASYLLLTTGNAQSGEGVCKCDDMAQIQRRIDEDAVAIRAFTDKYLSGSAFTLDTSGNRSALQASVQAQLSDVQTSLVQFLTTASPANTYKKFGPPDQCVTDYTEPDLTHCIRAALGVHEWVHETACAKGDWPYTLLRGFIKEEIDAYTAESNFLVGEKSRLLCTCPYYALRFSLADTINAPFGNEQFSGEGKVLGPSSNDINIPLKIEAGGKVSGQAQAEFKANLTGSGVTACQGSAGDIPVAISVDGQLAPPPVPSLHVDITNQAGQGPYQAGCAPVGTVSGTNGGGSLPFKYDIGQIDTPVEPSSEPQLPYVTWTTTSELIIADPWPNTKASNGRGSTVGDALHEIGMPSCSQ